MKKLSTHNVDRRLASLKRIGKEPIYLRPKERGGREDVDEDGNEVYPWIRPASTDDVRLVESWLGSDATRRDTEFRWLGGQIGTGAPTIKKQIESWIASPYGAFILFFSATKDAKDAAQVSVRDQFQVAFMNIDDFPEGPVDKGRNLEVGRLIVCPDYRRRGYGSTLLRHVTRVLGESEISSSINARVLQDNSNAQAMLGKLPFIKTDIAPHYERNSAHKCVFFRYELTRRGNRLGEQIAKLRKEQNLNQAQAAFLCGVAPSMINMLESSRRYPSLGTLQDLTSILAKQPLDKMKLLLSVIGEQLDPIIDEAVQAVGQLPDEASPDSQKAHFWVFSDRFLEDIDNNVFGSSVSAIRSEFDRWYFVPPGYWENQGEMLVKRFRSAQLADGTTLSAEEINRHLRFYKAPAAICAMRIAIRVPHLEHATSGAGPVKITIGGKHAARFGVENERSIALMASVLKVVRNLDSLAAAGEYPELEGFTLLFPRLAANQ